MNKNHKIKIFDPLATYIGYILDRFWACATDQDLKKSGVSIFFLVVCRGVVVNRRLKK
jgi:hypothetical protein